MAELGVAPHDTAVISGIGCSSRLPYYMNTYAMQTVHGRAAAISTGCKVANPKITVWQISGDGDGLAIGGNHFIHAVRRNIDLNMILLNNRIYGYVWLDQENVIEIKATDYTVFINSKDEDEMNAWYQALK